MPPRLRLELTLQHLRRRPPDRFARGHAGDLLGCAVPQHDVTVAVDRDDPVGDVREDRDALLTLDGDALVQLGVRQRRGRVRGECDERLHLFLTPHARRASVDREHAVQPAVGRAERHAEIRGVAGGEERVSFAQAVVLRHVLVRRRRARTDDVARRARPGRRPAAERVVGAASPTAAVTTRSRSSSDASAAASTRSSSAACGHDRLDDRGRVELCREQAAGPRELLGQRARRPLDVEEPTALERSARGAGDLLRELEILAGERVRLVEEDERRAPPGAHARESRAAS